MEASVPQDDLLLDSENDSPSGRKKSNQGKSQLVDGHPAMHPYPFPETPFHTDLWYYRPYPPNLQNVHSTRKWPSHAYSPFPGITLAAWTALIFAIQPVDGWTLRTVRSSSEE